jgi:hypothetical protein
LELVDDPNGRGAMNLVCLMLVALLPLFAGPAPTGGSGASPAPHRTAGSDDSAAPARTAGISAEALRSLPFLHDLYTFRGAAGTTVVAAYAVEAGDLLWEHVSRGVRYRFDVSLVLTDTILHSVINRHDSVYVQVRRPLAGDHLLFTTIEVEAEPSAAMQKRVYMYNATAPGKGQLYTSPFVVPDYSGSDLMLSDIALGQADARGGWRRGGVALALLPSREFPGSAFEVYYEIYNLPRGHAYRTEIAVAEVGGAGDRADRPMVRLSFNGEAPAAPATSLPELRRVETSLPRGDYRIEVTVTDLETGVSASRSRTFEVHGRRHATMVHALPVASSRSRR